MRPLLYLLALAATSGVTASRLPSYNYVGKTDDVASYLNSLVPVARSVLTTKIAGPAIGADPGVIITVIPEGEQDRIYWLRDACFAYYAFISELEIVGNSDVPLRGLVDDYVHALIRTQHVLNPSGSVSTGGLNEALFDVKIDKVTVDAWRIGSPAADGPPLRAIVLIKYAEWLLRPEQKNGTWVADVLWPAINLDLQWISAHWNESSWDLWWAPVWGGSYWTATMQHRRKTDDPGFDGIASLTFWNEEKGFMTETTITKVTPIGGRSGIGAAPLTVAVQNFDPTLGCDPKTFQPCSDRALSSLKVVGDAFRKIFPIDQTLPPDQFPYFGFFIEDELFGGQVQYFASFNVAEQIYDALITWDIIGKLDVTKVSLEFFRQFDKTIKVGTYLKHSITYRELTSSLKLTADNTIRSLAKRTPPDLILPLTMNKTSGEPMTIARGALRSQVAVLGARGAYNGVIPPSWYNGGPGPKSLEEPVVDSGPCHGGFRDESQIGFGYY
ncbi:Six-hairpin glycosidase-like protein [Russula earlei]|uniref:Six-hairpin glycosidase-like protein n=1 Tax=Russula earlei TaxID=71964 RepID=A0ACC0U2C7_9AGAM|nr:Six-hairpin glycosidase-like protein [Russula earlei]